MVSDIELVDIVHLLPTWIRLLLNQPHLLTLKRKDKIIDLC